MKKEFDFSREFGEIDEKLVESAGREWNRKKYNVLKLYSRKIARSEERHVGKECM